MADFPLVADVVRRYILFLFPAIPQRGPRQLLILARGAAFLDSRTIHLSSLFQHEQQVVLGLGQHFDTDVEIFLVRIESQQFYQMVGQLGIVELQTVGRSTVFHLDALRPVEKQDDVGGLAAPCQHHPGGVFLGHHFRMLHIQRQAVAVSQAQRTGILGKAQIRLFLLQVDDLQIQTLHAFLVLLGLAGSLQLSHPLVVNLQPEVLAVEICGIDKGLRDDILGSGPFQIAVQSGGIDGQTVVAIERRKDDVDMTVGHELLEFVDF